MKLVALKRLSLAILAAGLVAVLTTKPAHADEWAKTYTLSGKPDLRIETSDANIRVTTWDQNTIEAKVISSRYKIGDGGLRVEEHQTGDSVEIDVRYPHHDFNVGWGNHRVDITIQMPREGRVNLRTGDGKIDITGLKGDMDLHTGDGSETLEGVEGKLHATTGDGHITAQGRFDELELKTGDGHVDVRAAQGSTLAAGWRLETGDGNVSLEIPSELSADVGLHTSDGHIDLDMPITTEGKIREGEIHGKLNGGGNPLTIHTGDGSIHLRKG
jgi:Putative adhesin